MVWESGLRMIRAHPVMGIGLGNFKPLLNEYEDPGQTQRLIAHNAYIEIGAEMGLPALLVFLASLCFSYHALERVRRRTLRTGPPLLHQAALSIQAGLVGCAVALFFVSGQYEKLFWLMVFLTMCLPSLAGLARPVEDIAGRAALFPDEGSVRSGFVGTGQPGCEAPQLS